MSIAQTCCAPMCGTAWFASCRSQEHGSLRDLLQNQTLLIEEDMAFSILKDIVQVRRQRI